jgi:hypothetical protein
MPLFKYPLLSYFECMDAEKSHKKATTPVKNGAKKREAFPLPSLTNPDYSRVSLNRSIS